MKGPCALDELIRQGARQVIHQAIEAELSALLEHYSNVKTPDGRRAIGRNGYQPERGVFATIGPVPVQVTELLAIYDFSAEHWQHVRTVIDSTGAQQPLIAG